MIDDAFTIKEQRWGTFVSVSASGEQLITSLTANGCIEATRWYLKRRQDNESDRANPD